MTGEVVELSTVFRRLPRTGRAWPLADTSTADVVEVRLSNFRLAEWRWPAACPKGATHWRPLAA